MTTFHVNGMVEPNFPYYLYADIPHPFLLTIATITWNNGLVIKALDSQSNLAVFINVKQHYRHFSLSSFLDQ